MRLTIATGATLAALALFATPAFATDSLSVTVPATITPGQGIDAQVTGNTEDFGERFEAFVQSAACPPTVAEAEQQPNAVPQDNEAVQGGGEKGPFSLSASLSDAPPDRNGNPTQLTGVVNVCSYLWEFDSTGIAKATRAVDVDQVNIKAKPAKFHITIPTKPKMNGAGKIVGVVATCPRGCGLSVVFVGLDHKHHQASIHVSASPDPVGLLVPVDARTKRQVKHGRRKRSRFTGVPASVSAAAHSGGHTLRSHREVRVF